MVRKLVFALALCALVVSSVLAAEPAMKILGPDGQDITGNIQQLMEDNPAVMREFSQAFKQIEQAANQLEGQNPQAAPADADAPAAEGTPAADNGAAAPATDGGEKTELFVKWTVQLNDDGTMALVDQGNPECTTQYPVGGGSRMFNVCTMRKIQSSLTQNGAQSGTLSGDDLPDPNSTSGSGGGFNFPNAGNGFSSSGFGNTWGPGIGNGSGSGFGNGVSVTTSGNKVDISTLDVTPPELFISLDASDGRMSSAIKVNSALAHEPIVQIPEDSNPRTFYGDQAVSPFRPGDMMASGLVQGKGKKLTAEGMMFDPKGEFLKVEASTRAQPVAGTKNFDVQFTPSNLGDVKAIYVPENVRMKILTQAIDADEDFETIQPEPGQNLNRYNMAINNLGAAFQDFRREAAKTDAQVSHIFSGNENNTGTFPGIKAGSLQWKVVQRQGGTDVDYAVPPAPDSALHVLFRKSDYKAGANPEDANFFLTGEVKDLAGNLTALRIPIWVTPTSFESSTMQQQSERN